MIPTYRFAQGTRVRVRRGRFPMDPALIGRTGLIVGTDDYRPERYGVVLDEEEEVRELNEDELEPLGDAKPPELAVDAGPSVGR
ncbi:MAG: hypothetical protein EXR95_06180 [Gemmatimonadetes bacterium]|nr:hypothetical protein [Gemmatimonadota bacterium]